MSGSLWDYTQWMRDVRHLSPATVRSRRRVLERAEADLGPLHRVRSSALRDWWGGFARGLAPATINRYRSDLRAFYAWCVDDGRRKDDPSRRLDAPRRPRYLPRPVATEDAEMALATAEPRTRVCIALMYEAGLRCIEVARLDRDDIVDGRRMLAVRGKGDKERVVPMSARLAAELHAWGLPAYGPVVPRERGHGYQGGRLSASRIGKMVGDHMRGVGIDASAHQLRHAFALRFLEASGGDVAALAEVLGHANLNQTRVYARWGSARLRAVVDAMDDAPSERQMDNDTDPCHGARARRDGLQDGGGNGGVGKLAAHQRPTGDVG